MVLLDGQGREAMIAADVVMLRLGTAALEAMLSSVKKTHGGGLQAQTFSYLLPSGLVKTDYVPCRTCWRTRCWCPSSSSTSAPGQPGGRGEQAAGP